MTHLPTDEQIDEAARVFRAALDALGPEPWARKGMTFPRGACGHAAEMLGLYLINRYGIIADYINRNAYSDISGWTGAHSWLVWNGLTIDITGDQFGWLPVIVTREPSIHWRGEDQIRHRVCLEHQADWWARECGSIWNDLQQHLVS